jgi:hypothetical protein
MTRYILGTVLAAAMTAGCNYERQENPTGPGSAGMQGLNGNWASTSALPSRESCSNFQWSITELTATSASGSFGATCSGDLRIQGTAAATLSGDVINWNAAATATNVPVVGTCPISLLGTAELGVDSVLIRYNGGACGVAVNGVETLRRR